MLIELFNITLDPTKQYYIPIEKSNIDKVLQVLESKGFLWWTGTSPTKISNTSRNIALASTGIQINVNTKYLVKLHPFNLNTKIKITPIFEEPLTNEQILTIFLKKHRKYSAFMRNLNCIGKFPIRTAIDKALFWDITEEGWCYWDDLEDKWVALCDKFNLKGDIDFSLFK